MGNGIPANLVESVFIDSIKFETGDFNLEDVQNAMIN